MQVVAFEIGALRAVEDICAFLVHVHKRDGSFPPDRDDDPVSGRSDHQIAGKRADPHGFGFSNEVFFVDETVIVVRAHLAHGAVGAVVCEHRRVRGSEVHVLVQQVDLHGNERSRVVFEVEIGIDGKQK